MCRCQLQGLPDTSFRTARIHAAVTSMFGPFAQRLGASKRMNFRQSSKLSSLGHHGHMNSEKAPIVNFVEV